MGSCLSDSAKRAHIASVRRERFYCILLRKAEFVLDRRHQVRGPRLSLRVSNDDARAMIPREKKNSKRFHLSHLPRKRELLRFSRKVTDEADRYRRYARVV